MAVPSTPSTPVVVSSNASSTTLEWNPAYDDVVTTRYDVYDGGTLLGNVAATNTWTQRALPGMGNYRIYSSADKFFVMYPGSTTLYTSPNGLTWTARTLPVSGTWFSAAYGNNMYVAASSSSTVALSSPDGITWTQRTMPSSANWGAMAWGNNIFVAVSGTTAAASSPDGINWTARTLPAAGNSWYSAAYGPSGFVTLGFGGNVAASSTDGLTWTQRALPVGANWTSVAYGNGTYVAVSGSSSNIAVTSTNATTWTQRTLPASADWNSVTFSNGLFTAVAGNSTTSATSPDGITWTQRTLPTSANWISVAGLNGFFVAVPTGSAGGLISTFDYSPTPQYVATTTPSGTYKFNVKAWDGTGSSPASASLRVGVTPDTPTGLVVASSTPSAAVLEWKVSQDDQVVTAYDVYNNAGLLGSATSTNAWTTRTTLPANIYWMAAAYGNGVFVATAGYASNIYNIAATSISGVSWTTRTLPTSGEWQAIAYGGGTFVALNSGTSIAATSPDGITWTQRALPSSRQWQSIAYGNGTFVTVANNSAIAATSPDGITWTQQAMPSSALWQDVAYGNGRFVAIVWSNNNKTAYSLDGITWTERTLPVTAGWIGIAYGNGLFVAIAPYDSGGAAAAYSATSPDGITWTYRGTPYPFRNIAFSSGLFVATGIDTSASSPDGINWTIRTFTGYLSNKALTGGEGLFVGLHSSQSTNVSTFAYSPVPTYTAALSQGPAGNNYNFSVRARDSQGNASAVTPSIFYSTGPDAPTELVKSNVSPTSLTLTWNPVYDDVLTTAYDVYNGATLIGNVTPTNTWIQRTLPTSTTWTSIAYGDGLFVAVSSSSISATSTNGITWTQRSIPTGNIISLTYGNGVFVGVASSGTGAMRSVDGINWTTATLPASQSWKSVCYGTPTSGIGTFVAIASTNNAVAWSSDNGVTWGTSGLGGGVTTFVAVAFGNSTFSTIADGTNSTWVGYSFTGSGSWTLQSSRIAAATWRSLTFGNGVFVAVGNNAAATSASGQSYTSQTIPSGNWKSVTFDKGLFVAVADAGSNYAATSPDGITWTARTLTSSTWSGVAGGNGFFTAVAVSTANAATYDYAPTPRYVATLTQGIDYNFNVKARDASGGVSSASPAVVYATVPTVPTGLAASNITPTSVTLTWTASYDEEGVTAYLVYNGASLVSTVTAPTTQYNATLIPGNTYNFTVKARDANNNLSPASTALNATAPDIPVISSVASVNRSVTVTWGAVAGAASYEIFRDGVTQGTPSSTSFTQTVNMEGTYSYTVRSKSAGGFWSALSAPYRYYLDFTPPPSPTNVSTTRLGNEVTVSWVDVTF